MIARILVAVVGALVITSVLFLGMDAVTSLFRERDVTRYFRVNDVTVKDRSGLPDRPRPVPRQPDTPRAARDLPADSVPLENPDLTPPAASIPGRLLEPEIETGQEPGGPEAAEPGSPEP
jgi:hypothetical protein